MTHILGIRHHGPGSAKHVLEALNTLNPDIILIEGPPEGENMLEWVNHQQMKPPVALLAYVPDNPQKAVFYPFTNFSPEWQAMQFGQTQDIPIRFIDMPLVHKLAPTPEAQEELVDDSKVDHANIEIEKNENIQDTQLEIVKNPLSYLAEIAGFDDTEEWWEHQFELAQHPIEVFDAIGLAIEALRNELPEKDNPTEQIREAFMRKAIRKAKRDKFENIVVICGAWHVPALKNMPTQKVDNELLKGLPKTKVETTWIPWTADRLSFESGYGAGVNSPGWYNHFWNFPEDDGTIWLTHVATVFRKHQIDISSAHIIEAVRLANALAGLRNLSKPSLKEYNEATKTIMCMGDEILMDIVWKDLIVGNELGEVPEGTPQIPLQRDLEQKRKSLRLKASNFPKDITLDLRKDTDLNRSILFHRLQVLDIDWAVATQARGKGTFKESWRLEWQPELTIKLLEKAPWGNTIKQACNQYLIHLANTCNQLSDITFLVQKALPAELQEGIRAVMFRMDELASDTSDTSTLMDALLPLIQIKKYGNVRKTDMDTISIILDSIFFRILVGLPISCTGIDEEQGSQFAEKIKGMNQGILLLDNEQFKSAWIDTLIKTTEMQQVSAIVHGTCCKILYDIQHFDAEQTAIEFGKALSPTNDPSLAAAWLEGFLKDAAAILLLDDNIWNIVNTWTAELHENIFHQILPLLRRTFADYNSVEKQKIAEKVKQGVSGMSKPKQATAIDHERASKVLPILELVMGIN